MARNQGKRPGGASGSKPENGSQVSGAQAAAGAPPSKTGDAAASQNGGKQASKASAAGHTAIAAKTGQAKADKAAGTDNGSSDVARPSSPAGSAASSHAAAASSAVASPKVGPQGSPTAGRAVASTSGGGQSGAGSSSGSFWPGLIGGVIGGAAVALAASLFWMDGREDATAALEGRLTAAEEQVGQLSQQQDDRLGALTERVAAVEAAPPAAAEGDEAMGARLDDLEAKLAALGDAAPESDDGGLSDRLLALEQQIAALGDLEGRIETLAADMQAASQAQQASAQTLTALEGSLPTLEDMLAATGKAVEDTGARTSELTTSVETLDGDVQALAARVGEAEGRLDHLGGEYQRGAAMIVAIGDVNRAITNAEPFDSPLQSLKSLVRDDALLDQTVSTLEPMAAAGVPALSDLKSEFGAVASQALRAEQGDPSLADQVGSNLFGVLNMRPAGADVEGSGSRAVLARAQAKLSADDLDGAIAELAGLEGAAAEETEAWVERARSRLSAEAAIADLRTHAQSLIARGS